MPACPSCGRQNPDDARYCSGCGTSFAVSEPDRESRKVVSVLFCDLVGSTALGDSTDPEALRTRMRRYFDDLRAIVERHGGTVEKFIGDAVMAVFGVPVAHEDDALRAVRAAAEMRKAVSAHGLEARIGVNTGEVVVGGSGDTLVTGDAVNVAARLEQSAKPDEILIGVGTRALVRGAARVAAIGPLDLKGKSAPVDAFRLLEVIDDAEPFVRSLDTPLVGRERERERLWRDFEDAVADRACRLFTLLGAAGVGKSRLVADLLERVDGTADVLRGRCLHYGEGITYWPLVELLGSAGVPPETVVAPSPEETRVRVRRLLEARASARPQVVVIDDLQWAESTFLDLVEHVADLSRDAPILLLCIARPELLDIRPGWSGGKLNATSLLLEPLGAEACEQLIDRLVADAAVDAATRERIRAASGGNPLFVEEMVAMVREGGERDDVGVPATIHALLQARLDALPDRERLVVGRAAIEGQVFHAVAVAALLPEELGGELKEVLASLIRKELVRPDGEDAFRFRHLLIRDAAYAALPKALRADLHARFGKWLEGATEPTLELDEIVAYHLEQAFRLRTELGDVDRAGRELADAAAQKLLAAGRGAYNRADLPAAIGLLRRGVGLLAQDDRRRARELSALASALTRHGEFAEAGAVLREAIPEATAAGDRAAEIRARLLLRALAWRTDPSARIEDQLAEALELVSELEELGDLETLALAHTTIGSSRFVLGRAAEGAADFERAADLARRAGEVAEEQRALNALLRPKLWGPTPAQEIVALCDVILEREDVNVGLRVHAHQALAFSSALLGNTAGSRDAARSAATLIDEYDLALERGLYAIDVGFAIELSGDLEGAEAELRRGYELLNALGETGVLATVTGELATVLAQLDRFAEAEALAAEARSIAASDDFDAQTRWRVAVARLHLRQGHLEEAERFARDAVAVVAGTDFIPLVAEGLHVLGEVLAELGRSADAAAALERARELYERKGNVVRARDVQRLLEAASTAS